MSRGRAREPRVGADGRAKVGCPGCGTDYMVPEASLDKQLRCKICGTGFVPNQAAHQHGEESFNATPYYIGGGVLVAVIALFLMLREGTPAKAAKPRVEPKPIALTGMDNVRVRDGKAWGLAMSAADTFNLRKFTDFDVARGEFPAADDDGVMAAMLGHETAHWFDEFEITSAGLDDPQNHDASSGKIILYLTAKPEWSSKKGGKPYWYPQQNLELALGYVMRGGQPKYGGWKPVAKPRTARRRKPGHKSHGLIGKAKEVKRMIGGEEVTVIEAEPAPLPHLDDTPAGLRTEIDGLVPKIKSDDPREVNRAIDRLATIAKPAIPILLTQLFQIDPNAPDAIYHLRNTCQTLEQITGQRFGFTSAASISGESTAVVRESALKQWFGYWTTHHDRKDWDLAREREERESLEIDEPAPDKKPDKK